MTTIAWWHCFSGIAGDMALASLVDAGARLDLVERELAALPVGGWVLEAEEVLRGGLAATAVHVRLRPGAPTPRTHAHIVGLVTEARLPDRARHRALGTFARLAAVEGRLHRQDPAAVHFHEVGGVDAIIDVVGTCVALEVLSVDEVQASPVAQGLGTVRAAHGLLPTPAPAVLRLLEGVPTYGVDVPDELTTPTGAALVAALATRVGPLPALTPTASGYGAGGRELEGRPNVVQVVVGTAMATAPPAGQPVVLLESNVDDVTGEVLAHTVSAVLAAGAHDAWLTPVLGKKGRPAQVISALVDAWRAEEVRAVISAETGTLGVRRSDLTRWTAPRQAEQVEVGGHPVGVKRGPHRVKAEHDDAARVAALLDLPVREVARRAEERAHAGPEPPPPTRPG